MQSFVVGGGDRTPFFIAERAFNDPSCEMPLHSGPAIPNKAALSPIRIKSTINPLKMPGPLSPTRALLGSSAIVGQSD